MDWSYALLIVLGLVLLFLFMGQWIAMALGTAGVLGLYVFGLEDALSAIANVAYNQINSFVLTAVPLFILTGEIIVRGGISVRFYRGITTFIGGIPGGLLHSNIVASAIFSAISGSSVASTSAISSVAVPEQTRLGYDRKLMFGSLAAGGTLGILIPPSIPLIIYGVLANESVVRLFLAGLLPGIALSILFSLYILARSFFQGGLAPKTVPDERRPGLMRSLIDIAPICGLIVLLFGGIYFGVTTPTEAAAVSVVLAILISTTYGTWTWASFGESLMSTVATTCMVLFIIIGAQILSYLIGELDISRGLTRWVATLNLSPIVLILVLTMIYLVLGMFMEGISMIYLTFPVLFPIVVHLQIDPIWFGIYLVVMIEMSLITPPVGLNLFVLKGVARDAALGEIFIGTAPFVILMLAFVAIITLVPELVLWLPGGSSVP